ncbi:hypothetical protein P3589_23150 [Vibrio parahaemolyticus]|nr:hypothetical protein [Vibrio parahaemolyticus]
MSQRVDGILRMVAQLSAEEKAELMYKVSGRGSGFGNDFEFRQKGGHQMLSILHREVVQNALYAESNITKRLRQIPNARHF